MGYHTPGNPGPGHSNIPSGLPWGPAGTPTSTQRLGNPVPPSPTTCIRPARRYGEPVVPKGTAVGQDYRQGRSRRGTAGMGSGQTGPLAGQYSNADVANKIVEATGVYNNLEALYRQINTAISTYSGILTGTEPVSATAQQAVNDLNAAGSTLEAAISGTNPAGYNSFALSTTAWKALDAAEAVANPVYAQYSSQNLPSGLKQAAASVTNAAAQATQQAAAAAAQVTNDNATISQARSSSANLMNQGNYTAATAALNASNVTSAAARLNYDLSPDLNAITTAQTNAQTSAANSAAQLTVNSARSNALALMNQGNYTGALAALQSQSVQSAANQISYDLTPDIAAVTGAQTNATNAANAANAAAAANTAAVNQVNAAITQAQSLDAAGSYKAALLALEGVTTAAATAGMTSQVQALIAQIQSDNGIANQTAACAAAGGTWNGSACIMPTPAAVAAAAAAANPTAAAQASCIQQGGQWDGANCTLPPPAWITQLLPTLLAPQPSAPVNAPSYAPVTSGPSQEQLTAMAMLSAFGGASGQGIAAALAPSMAPQGSSMAAPGGAPDGTPCAMSDGSAGIYQGGQCLTVAPPSGTLYGAPSAGESF